jgi:hypothetical protein
MLLLSGYLLLSFNTAMKPHTANQHKQAEEVAKDNCLRIMRTLAEKYEKGELSKIELKLEKKVMVQGLGLVAESTSASKRPAAAPTSASKKRPAAAPTSASSKRPAAAPTSVDDYYYDY